MNRRNLLVAMGAGAVASALPFAVDASTPASADNIVFSEDLLWGDYALPAILDALGVSQEGAQGVSLHFEYGQFATATITREGVDDEMHYLPGYQYGTNCVSPSLTLPKGVQAITVHVGKGQFTTVETRHVPISTQLSQFLDAIGA